MLKTLGTRGRFFSVADSVLIQGVKYNQSICYPLTDSVRPAVERMEAEGTARIYTEKMRFVSGTAYPVKKPDAALSFSASPETGAEVKPGIKKSSASIGKLGRKTGR